MKMLFRIFFLLFIFTAVPAISQDASTGTSEQKKNDVENARTKRKKNKAEWKAKRAKEKADRKAIRQHEKRLQTKATRKRMHKDQRKANPKQAQRPAVDLPKPITPQLPNVPAGRITRQNSPGSYCRQNCPGIR